MCLGILQSSTSKLDIVSLYLLRGMTNGAYKFPGYQLRPLTLKGRGSQCTQFVGPRYTLASVKKKISTHSYLTLTIKIQRMYLYSRALMLRICT